MALKFAYRSNSATGNYFSAGKRDIQRVRSPDGLPLIAGPTGTFGGTYLQVNGNSVFVMSGMDNAPCGSNSMTLLFRVVPDADGAPSPGSALINLGQVISPVIGLADGISVTITSAGKARLNGGSRTNGFAYFNATDFPDPLTFFHNVPTDIWVIIRGDGSANGCELWQAQNGQVPTLVSTLTASTMQVRTLGVVTEITLGYSPCDGAQNSDLHYNEAALWDTAENPISYGARADFIPSPTGAAFEGYASTALDPSQVSAGVIYGPGPGSQVGTRQTVTNVMESATIFGQSGEATLVRTDP